MESCLYSIIFWELKTEKTNQNPALVNLLTKAHLIERLISAWNKSQFVNLIYIQLYCFQYKCFAKTVLHQFKTILYEAPEWANYVSLMFLSTAGEDKLEDRFYGYLLCFIEIKNRSIRYRINRQTI